MSVLNLLDVMTTMKERNCEGNVTISFDGKIDGAAVKMNYAIMSPQTTKTELIFPTNIQNNATTDKTSDLSIEFVGRKIVTVAYNGEFMAIADETKTIEIIDVASKKLITVIDHQKPGLKFMSFSPLTDQLVCCYVDVTNDIVIYNIKNGAKIADLKKSGIRINGAIMSFYVSSERNDGVIILGTSGGGLVTLNLRLTVIHALNFPNPKAIIYASALDRNTTTLLQGMMIQKYRHQHSDIIKTITYKNGSSCITTSLDQNIIVTTYENMIRIYRNQTQVIQDPQAKNAFQSIIITPDNMLVVTLDSNQNIKVWNIETGVLVRASHLKTPITHIVATPDSNLILIYSASDTFVALFNITNDAITFY